jgi:hypothetical protein
MHDNMLLGWTDCAPIEVISDKFMNYQYMSDECFYYQVENPHSSSDPLAIYNTDVKLVECRYSVYDQKTMVENLDPRN